MLAEWRYFKPRRICERQLFKTQLEKDDRWEHTIYLVEEVLYVVIAQSLLGSDNLRRHNKGQE